MSPSTLKSVGDVGASLSTTSHVSASVFAFHTPSVTVTVVSVPSNHPLHTVPVQDTDPLAVAGLGLQAIPGTVTVAPFSTLLKVVVTNVPSFAGFGNVDTTVGINGAVSSITKTGEDMFVFVFPLVSVTEIALLLPSSNPHVAVAVQSTVPLAVAGLGAQVIPGTITVAPLSIFERLSVTVFQV